MRNLIIAAAAAGLVLSTTAAFASVVTVNGNYSVSEQYSYGGPGITYGTIHNSLLDHTNFSVGLPEFLGNETTPQNFFTANPASSCKGTGCSGVTETDLLTISFTNLTTSDGGGPIALSTTATFTAKYSGSALACSGKTSRHTQSDCLVWAGASNGYSVLTGDLGNGEDLNIYLYNAEDWAITPQIGFELTDALPKTPVPEPGSLALLGTALVGLGLIRRRRRTAS